MSALPSARLAALAPGARRTGRLTSPFEFWPGWLFHAPIVVQWIALGLRHGDFSLPSAANPHITTGGLCGESKISILDQVSGPARALLAPYASFVAGGNLAADMALAGRTMRQAGLSWPMVVKPDIGCNGTGVRLVADAPALERYLAGFPPGARVLLQEFVPYEGEAGLFYIRHPDAPRGMLTSVTLKASPVVVGDGRSTLEQLVLADPRAGRVPHLYLPRLGERRRSVPPAGERVRLVFVGNHCKGATFRDGADEITPALTEAIDAIARAMPDFHFGRFDLRFESSAALRRGTGFRIIEINGVGSEATHVWDPNTTLPAAYRAQFYHYRMAFEIGRVMRARGVRTCGLRAILRAWRLQSGLLASYPMND